MDRLNNMEVEASRPEAAGHALYAHTYLLCGRIFSYAHQLHSVLSLAPRTVLEVGVGPGMVTASLRAVGVSVTTLDTDESLRPDLVASVTRIPVPDAAFDVALCCQVLEHLPFDIFQPILRELHRVTQRALVLSLPDVSRYVECTVLLPRLALRRLGCTLPRLRPPQFPLVGLDRHRHCWEIGFAGYPLRRVRTATAASGWRLERTWRVPELAWHRFFLLTKQPHCPDQAPNHRHA